MLKKRDLSLNKSVALFSWKQKKVKIAKVFIQLEPSLAFTEISCCSDAAASELDALRQPGLLSWRAALAGGAARPLGRLARLALLGR